MSRTYRNTSTLSFLAVTLAFVAIGCLSLASVAQAVPVSYTEVFSDNFDSFANNQVITSSADWTTGTGAATGMRARNDGVFQVTSLPNVASPVNGALGDGAAYNVTGINTSQQNTFVRMEATIFAVNSSSGGIVALAPITTTSVVSGPLGWIGADSSLSMRLIDTTVELASYDSDGVQVGFTSVTGLTAITNYDVRVSAAGLSGVVNASLEYKLNSSSTWITAGTILTDGSWSAGNLLLGAEGSGAVDNLVLSTGLVPEPSTIVMLSLGLVGLISSRRRRRSAA